MKRARLLAFVLTAAMATSVFLGGTVARYQTSATIGDEATVAKWGVKLTMAGNLFGYNYVDGDVDASKPTTVTTDSGISVKYDENTLADATDNVAPGTSGDTLTISLTGNTEVDVAFSTTVTTQDVYLVSGTYAIFQKVGTLLQTEFDNMVTLPGLYWVDAGVIKKAAVDGWSDSTVYYTIQNQVTSTAEYHPIDYTCSLAPNPVKLSALETLLESNIKNDDVQATTPLDTLGFSNVTITWKWKLENTDFATNCSLGSVNDLDTVLGALKANAADVIVATDVSGDWTPITAGGDGVVKYSDTIVGSVKTSFSITVEVHQED